MQNTSRYNLSCKSKGPAPTWEGRGGSVRDSAGGTDGMWSGQLGRKQRRRTEVGQRVVGHGRTELGLPRA